MKKFVFALLLSPALAFAQAQMPAIVKNSTSVVLPAFALYQPSGVEKATGITNLTPGLEIRYRWNDSDGWASTHTQAGSTINAITGTIGQFETPDANDVHFEEIAASAGKYQLILPDSAYAGLTADSVVLEISLTDGGTAFADADFAIPLTTALNDIDEAGVRTAVGLATANLDTQLNNIASASAPTVEAIRTEIDTNSTQLSSISADTVAIRQDTETDGVPLTTAAITAIWQHVVDGTITAECSMAIQNALVFGEFLQQGSSVTAKEHTGTNTRLTATLTSNARNSIQITCP